MSDDITPKCEMCDKEIDLDVGFLNIAEICDGTDENIEKFEKDNQVDLSNFWCVGCGSQALKEIEK